MLHFMAVTFYGRLGIVECAPNVRDETVPGANNTGNTYRYPEIQLCLRSCV